MRKSGLLFLVAVIAAYFVYAWRSPVSLTDPPPKSAFEPSLIRKGERIAAIGNCAVCHTRPGGEAFAGGLGIPTPFGTIYASNITRDPADGIGRWPEAAFARALREGVAADGSHLYPAFPYDHYTVLSDEDAHALYAYIMTREPVVYSVPPNDLAFPFNQRILIAVWKALYFREGRYRPDPNQSASWNRGAYLSEGLAHCGACHTPRNSLGAEKKSEAYNGAPVEGWHAHAINAASPAPIPWTQEALQFYLRHGWHEDHGIATGPMAPVAINLASASDEDVQAVAAYIASLAGTPSAERLKRGQDILAEAQKTNQGKADSADSLVSVSAPTGTPDDKGSKIYAAACASCHESGRPLPFGGINLALSSAIHSPSPLNLINITLYGLPQQPGNESPVMPGFRGSLSKDQLVALVTYIRSRFSKEAPWPALEKDAEAAKASPPRLWPTPGLRPVEVNSAQEVRPW